MTLRTGEGRARAEPCTESIRAPEALPATAELEVQRERGQRVNAPGST
jgi:hypothetical protein